MPRARYLPNIVQIHILRARLGRTQEELAEDAGLSRNTIHNVESGQAVSKDTLQRLANVFQVDWSQLCKIPNLDETPCKVLFVLNSGKYGSLEEARAAVQQKLQEAMPDVEIIDVEFGSIRVTLNMPCERAIEILELVDEEAFADLGLEYAEALDPYGQERQQYAAQFDVTLRSMRMLPTVRRVVRLKDAVKRQKFRKVDRLQPLLKLLTTARRSLPQQEWIEFLILTQARVRIPRRRKQMARLDRSELTTYQGILKLIGLSEKGSRVTI